MHGCIFLFADASDEWSQFAKWWGPAVPMFVVFIYYVHRLIFRVVPRGFKALRLTIVREGKRMQRNHREAMTEIAVLRELIEKTPMCRETRRRRQKT